MTLQGVSRAGIALVCGGLVAALLLSMFVTNPTKLGPTGVTLWFMGFWVVLSSCLAFINYELVMRFGREATRVNLHKVKTASLRHGLLIGGSLTVILALSSLQQLDPRDVGLIIAFVVLVEFYMRTRR
jgi:uncharacterized protein YacL